MQEIKHKEYFKPTLVYRFIRDYYLPINCAFNADLFFYDIKFFEKTHGSLTKWNNVCHIIETEYNGNVELFVADYMAVRDNIIKDLEATGEYKWFNQDPKVVAHYKDAVYPKSRYNMIFNQEVCRSGKTYWSFDLKNANFQIMKYYKVISDDTYDSFINRYCKDKPGLYEYITSSKYFRQVVFGKLNPGRTTKAEKAFMLGIWNTIIKEIMSEDVECCVFNSDEFIIEAGTSEQKEQIIEKLKNQFFDIRVEEYKVEGYEYYAYKEGDIENRKIGEFYRRTCDSLNKLRCINGQFMKPVLNAYLGQENTEFDKVVVYDKCTAVLQENITIKRIV